MSNKAEVLMWVKYKFFEVGISPRELSKCKMSDIYEILEIKEAIEQRKAREEKVQNMIANMGRI